MTLFENLSSKQKSRAVLHRDIRSICEETCHFLGLDIKRPAVDLITELVYKKVTLYGSDLEAFARHAKRSTITPDDVKLLVRRNSSLKEHLSTLCNIPSATKDKRRKTVNKIETVTKESAEKTDKKAAEKESVFENDVEDMIVDNTIDLTFD